MGVSPTLVDLTFQDWGGGFIILYTNGVLLESLYQRFSSSKRHVAYDVYYPFAMSST